MYIRHFYCSDEIADSLLTKIYAIKQSKNHKTSVSDIKGCAVAIETPLYCLCIVNFETCHSHVHKDN